VEFEGVIEGRLLDGAIQLLYHDKKLKFKEIAQPAAAPRPPGAPLLLPLMHIKKEKEDISIRP